MARRYATLFSYAFAAAIFLELACNVPAVAQPATRPPAIVHAGRPQPTATPVPEVLAKPRSSEGQQVSAIEPIAEPAAGGANSEANKPGDAAPASDAERVSSLERAIEEGQARLAQLKASLSDPDGEYATAEAEFKRLDAAMETARQTVREATESGSEAEVSMAKQVLQKLEPKWDLARQQFEVELQERRVLNDSVAVIEQKLQSDRAASDKLKGVGHASAPGVNAAPNRPSPTPVAPSAAAPSGASAAPPSTASPGLPILTASPDAPSDAAAGAADIKAEKAPSKELVEAKQVADRSAADADDAENEARSIRERIEILRKSVTMERELRDAIRKKVDIAEETLKNLGAEIDEGMRRGEDTEQLRLRLSESTRRQGEYRDEARRVTTQLDKLQSELNSLQAEQLAASEKAAAKRTIAVEAQQTVEHLENPFTVRNLMQWSFDHGPRLLAIVVGMGTLVWISRLMQSRLIRLMAGRGPRGNRDERENRARTLASVFHNAANLLIVGGGAIMVLEEAGIPIGPLVGGAAVIGLAVAFGAQSLIKDYFTGFILLLEQQYLINDVIRVGSIAGQVERISLRMTVLRDLEGQVHFIPHGEISSVTNLTHNWSRAVMTIVVAYKENVDHVIATINELGRDMRGDEQFRHLILEDLTMLGVDALGESGVILKLFIKTQPLQQWTVKREFLRRLKNRFDELGIEIPFPHRTVYHRQEASMPDNGESGNANTGNWSRENAA